MKGNNNRTSYRVIYGDTDQMGVVYYANYLRCFEKGRTEFLRQANLPYTSIEEKGLRFVVTEVSCRYLRPARYDDELIIETALTTLGRATLSFGYKISRAPDGLSLVTGWTKHACVNEKGEVARIPSDLESELKKFLSGSDGA